MDLIVFGGEVWIWVPVPVWLLGGLLALFAGLCCGWGLVGAWRKRAA